MTTAGPASPASPASPGVGGAARRWSVARLAVVLLAVVMVAGECHERALPPIVRTEPPPSYPELVDRHNAVVESLDPLFARISVRVRGRTERGRRFNEQAEGSLQIRRPRDVAVRIAKVSETLFLLGSNGDFYWWIDLIDDDARSAVVGRHQFATVGKVARLGLPVHPLDLVEVLNLAPWPESPLDGSTRWSADGREILVSLPARSGSREVRLDPDSRGLLGVAVFDELGRPLLRAEAELTVPVENRLDPTVFVEVPKRYIVTLVGAEAELRLELDEAQVRRLNDRAFDLQDLLVSRRVASVLDVDREAETAAPANPGSGADREAGPDAGTEAGGETGTEAGETGRTGDLGQAGSLGRVGLSGEFTAAGPADQAGPAARSVRGG